MSIPLAYDVQSRRSLAPDKHRSLRGFHLQIGQDVARNSVLHKTFASSPNTHLGLRSLGPYQFHFMYMYVILCETETLRFSRGRFGLRGGDGPDSGQGPLGDPARCAGPGFSFLARGGAPTTTLCPGCSQVRPERSMFSCPCLAQHFLQHGDHVPHGSLGAKAAA